MLSRCWQLSAVPACAHDHTPWCSAGSMHWILPPGCRAAGDVSSVSAMQVSGHLSLYAAWLSTRCCWLLFSPSAYLSTWQPLPWPLGASCPGVLHQPDMGMRSRMHVFSASPGLLSVAQRGTVSLWKTQPQQHRLGVGRSWVLRAQSAPRSPGDEDQPFLMGCGTSDLCCCNTWVVEHCREAGQASELLGMQSCWLLEFTIWGIYLFKRPMHLIYSTVAGKILSDVCSDEQNRMINSRHAIFSPLHYPTNKGKNNLKTRIKVQYTAEVDGRWQGYSSTCPCPEAHAMGAGLVCAGHRASLLLAPMCHTAPCSPCRHLSARYDSQQLFIFIARRICGGKKGQGRLIRNKMSNNYTILDENRRMITAHAVLLHLIIPL